MSAGDAIRKNLEFWHWYPRMLCEGLTMEQLHWQPPGHPNHIMYSLWHAYRSEDELIHGLLVGKPSVFERDGWARRLRVESTGRSPFGNGMDREQIAALRLPLEDVLAYAGAVGASIQEYADGLTPAESLEVVQLPFFAQVYPMLGEATRLEVLTFFCVGHTAEHLGEVQYIKGLMGLQGAPL